LKSRQIPFKKGEKGDLGGSLKLPTARLIPAKVVVSSKTGIQRKSGFRIKPGMTNPRGFGLNILYF
jgi:hypothetical protein